MVLDELEEGESTADEDFKSFLLPFSLVFVCIAVEHVVALLDTGESGCDFE